jgi:hypothetical protein
MTAISRPVAAGACAAVLLTAVIVLHGVIFAVLSWLAHPWRLAALIAAGLVLAAIWHGTFTRHSDRGIRNDRAERGLARAAAKADAARAQREAAVVIAAIEARRPLALAAPAHSATWGEPRTEIIDYAGPPLSDAEAAEIEERFLGDIANWKPSGFLNTGPVPAVVVTDDPAGRHARPRVHPFPPGQPLRPYCAAAGCTARGEHWTEEHPKPGPVAESLMEERERAARLPQYAIDALGHHTVDAALDSICGHAFPAVKP